MESGLRPTRGSAKKNAWYKGGRLFARATAPAGPGARVAICTAPWPPGRVTCPPEGGCHFWNGGRAGWFKPGQR